MRRIFVCPLYLAIAFTVHAQSPKLTIPEIEDATPAHWPTPEAVLTDLRSDDDQKRLRALTLIGVQTGVQTGKEVPAPDRVELSYATLAEDGSQQAIISAEIGNVYEYAAIATRSTDGWKRIGAFSCWCKYENGDVLADFVHLDIGSGGDQEVVIHSSGGGTGLYEQTESRFRMHNGRLIGVAAFESRVMSCPVGHPGPYACTVERRWFLPFGDRPSGAVLVQGRATFSSERFPGLSASIRDLDVRVMHRFTCTGYKWDPKSFRYVAGALTTNPCSVAPH